MRLFTEAEVKQTFGDPTPYIQSDGRVSKEWEDEILTSFPLQKPLKYAGLGIVKHVTCHKKVADSLKAVLDELANDVAWSTIDDYGGCYMWRKQRDANVLSRHCWGIAVDLDTNDNHMGTAGQMHPNIIWVFARHGWIWGGTFKGKRQDPMHFEFALS